MNWLKSFKSATGARTATGIQPYFELENNFSPRAQQVLALARREALRYHHQFVGTEHLLLGLIKLDQGVAVSVLRQIGVDLAKVRLEVEKLVPVGPDEKLLGNIPYTPRVKNALTLAVKEAKALHHTYVGTEHILLGLLREGDGIASRVLQTLGVDAEQIRLKIMHELDPNAPGPAEESDLLAPPNESGQPPSDAVDTRKRYDVYCREGDQPVLVFRNALFKGRRKLLSADTENFGAEFLELEQADGQIVFLSPQSILRFCEHRVNDPGGFAPPT